MRFSLCNEVLASLPLEKQCEVAARLGYQGLEIAPFTLSETPERITAQQAARVRATVESFGLVVTGLIVYVSLYPFRFVADGPALVEALRSLSWARAGRASRMVSRPAPWASWRWRAAPRR